MAEIWKAIALEGVDIVLYDLVRGLLGEEITKANVTALTAKVFDVYSQEQVGSPIVFDKDASVFDTLQTHANDARYPTTAGGFNVRVTIPGSYFWIGGHQFRVELYFAETSTPAKVYVDRWIVSTDEVLGFSLAEPA